MAPERRERRPVRPRRRAAPPPEQGQADTGDQAPTPNATPTDPAEISAPPGRLLPRSLLPRDLPLSAEIANRRTAPPEPPEDKNAPPNHEPPRTRWQ